MKALRLHGVRDFVLHDEPRPVPSPGEMLLRVTAVGLCGSDLHWVAEGRIGQARVDRPLILGHEFAGVIEGGERHGQRVAADPALPCDVCEWCLAGDPHLCANLRFAGHERDDGALREFMAWPAGALFALPDSLSDADGAMLEPLGVAIHAVDLGRLEAGMRVGVFGCGPIGLLILQVARAAGLRALFATDKLPFRLDAARSLGATRTFQADREIEAEAIMAATGRRGLDVAFEAAGENEAVQAAMAATRPGGRVVLVGIPADDQTTFIASLARRKELTIQLSRRMKHTYPRAIRLVESGAVEVRSLVTHRYPLSEFDRAFRAAEGREGLKVIIEP